MPIPLIQSFAKKTGKSIKFIENIWDETKKEMLASNKYKESDDSFYPILVSIIKKKLHLSELFLEFKKRNF